jgi:uncharacterized protein (DUF3820 family)
MTFGKHKGTPLAEVPKDYVRWLLDQPNVDPYVRQAFEILNNKKNNFSFFQLQPLVLTSH